LIGITAAPDRGAWFAAQSGWVGHITRHGRVRLWRTARHANPVDVVVGPDGATWFTEFALARIGRLRPGRPIQEIELETHPTSIVTGRDGALWVLTAGDDPFPIDGGLARIETSGHVTEYDVRPTAIAPAFGLASRPDGSLLFALDGGQQALGQYDPWLDPTLAPKLPPRP
jgi:virginiamycin B lyase